jgi:hypothetical protein
MTLGLECGGRVGELLLIKIRQYETGASLSKPNADGSPQPTGASGNDRNPAFKRLFYAHRINIPVFFEICQCAGQVSKTGVSDGIVDDLGTNTTALPFTSSIRLAAALAPGERLRG